MRHMVIFNDKYHDISDPQTLRAGYHGIVQADCLCGCMVSWTGDRWGACVVLLCPDHPTQEAAHAAEGK